MLITQPTAQTWHDQSVHRPLAHIFRVIVAVLLLGTLTACGVRLDTPPPDVQEPQGQDALRQQAAVLVRDMDTVATHTGPVTDAIEPILSAIAQDARSHLDSLGGVWEPPLRPDDDEDTETPKVEPVDPPGFVTFLTSGSHTLVELAAEADAELATLLVSISANQIVHARDLADALEIEFEDLEAPSDPFPAALGPDATDLCRVLDASGYVAEIRAARADGDTSDALAQRAAQLRADAELVATRADLTGTENDPRLPAYELDLEDLTGQAQSLALARLPAWLVLLGPATQEDRAVISWQVRSNALALYGADSPVPTLPGVED